MYQAYKFFPSRCPKCGHSFRLTSDFGKFYGKGKSFTDALQNQKEAFPDIFPKAEPLFGKVGYSDKFDIDFIFCHHCQNVTMRIDYALRQVATLDEATLLIEEQGFTGWQEVTTYGNMAHPQEHLSILAQADMMMLSKAIGEARNLALATNDQTIGSDVFSSYLDPALMGIMNKIRQETVSVSVRQQLRAAFGSLWEGISVDSRDFLISAEILKDELMSFSKTDPAIDFTSAVLAYSKALEKEILDRIFLAYRNSSFSMLLPEATGQNSLDRSLDVIKVFVDKKRNLTLGDMGFCLLNVGCKLKNSDNNGFAIFLQEIFIDFDNLCNEAKIPARIIKYSEDYRNRAAHVSRLSRDECLGARAFLLDEPVRLLLTLVERYKPLET